MRSVVVVPWVSEKELSAFCAAWSVPSPAPEWLILQHDAKREGCGVTKNHGIERAVDQGADIVVVLDGDCYPSPEAHSLLGLVDQHVKALQPQSMAAFQVVTDPPSRGTPYGELTMVRPVAASMGFWQQVPDYCAVRQLAFKAQPMTYRRECIFATYFPLCGMNLAFRPAEWWPWCQFIDVPRFDDIWMGWLWQKEAYRRGYCFNLAGPLVTHARQSNVWRNLIQEAQHLESNETLWRQIAGHESSTYDELRKLLPC